MNILVTGAAGYIGSTLLEYLLEHGHNVTALDTFRHGNTLARYCSNDKFTPIRADCRDNRVMKPLIEKADAIIPLAAIVGMNACANDEVAARTTNYQAVRMICDYASPAQRIVIPTTNSGYGRGELGEECTEDSPLRPISLYGITKVEAERSVMQRENSISFRLATAFGMSPKMRVDLLVNQFVYRAVTDRALVIFEGGHRRNFIHVRDISTAFILALLKFDTMRGKIFNCGDSRANMTKRQLAEEIQKVVPLTIVDAPTGSDPDQRDYLVSNARLERVGWMPSRTLVDGIKELVKGCTMLQVSRYTNA